MSVDTAGHLVTGRCWVFGDGINTDLLYPGFALRMPVAEAAGYVLSALRPEWAGAVRPGDVIVAGRNFGVGSSRPVPALLAHLGVAAVVAEEFNSLFLRNAINNGMPALTVPDARSIVTEGETVSLHLSEGWFATEHARLPAPALPAPVLDILDHGGLLARLVAQGCLPAEGGH